MKVKDSDIRKLISTAQEQGWHVSKGRKHILLRNPKTGYSTIASTTTVGKRGVANLRAQLRRGGLIT